MSDGDAPRVAALKTKLNTALIGDVLDAMGLTHQFLPPHIRPLRPEDKLVGRAMPLLEAAAFDDAKPFGLMFDAIDDLEPGEIYLATGAPLPCAMWGGLMTTLAARKGATGAVLNGYYRDTAEILQMDFPVFGHGPYAQDQRVRGRVIDYGVRVELGGVTVDPGDMLVGDIDGVVAIPSDLVDEVIERALEKQATESAVRQDILSGMGAAEAFEKYGVM
ncbi:RraA family protein [Oceanomicrobium pacificus]|uniref:Putative 4-hydroxy-4-methyl-2-oxoglutarate aldolase n=1 Tax=Oceanomicrobium pacificus TaxID=2692916 RepID=A0A6B0TZM8_9RHOB|nr:RraA family protein [Oceanomicrobium pacificus]MXU64351.1 RraA family protein [Oceanomicrobium pacificus]